MSDAARHDHIPTIAALISGGGRTVLNLQDAIDDRNLDARITTVIASSPSSAGIERCVSRGLKTIALDHTTEEFEDRVATALRDADPDLICLCGYLRHLRIEPWMSGRVINIHPSLLPAYGGRGMFGRHVHQAVLDAGELVSGCTVHFVDDVYDHGPTILRKEVVVRADDTADALAARVFEQECIAFPEAIRLILSAAAPTADA